MALSRVLVVEGLACLAGKINANVDWRRSATSRYDESTRVDESPSRQGWPQKGQQNHGGKDEMPHQPTPTQQRQEFFERARSSYDERQIECSPVNLVYGDPAPSEVVDPAPGAGVGLSCSHQLPSTRFPQREIGEGATPTRSYRSDQRVSSGGKGEVFARGHPNVNCLHPDKYFYTPALSPAREADVNHTKYSTISRVDGVASVPRALRSAENGESRAGKADVGHATVLRASPASEPGCLLEGFKHGNLGNNARGAADRSSPSDQEWPRRVFLVDTAQPAVESVSHQVEPQQSREDERWIAKDPKDIHGVRVDGGSGKFRRAMEGVRSLSPAPVPSGALTPLSLLGPSECHRRRMTGVESVTSDCSRHALGRVASAPSATGFGARQGGNSTASSRGMGGFQSSRADGISDRVDNQEVKAATPPEKSRCMSTGRFPHVKGLGKESEQPPKIAMDAALVEAWRRSSGASGGKPTVDAQGFADLGASSIGDLETSSGYMRVSEVRVLIFQD